MKLRLAAASTLLLVCSGAYAAEATKPVDAAAPASKVSLKTDAEKISYSIGMDLAQNFKAQAIDINQAAFTQGMQDGLSGATPAMTTEQREATLKSFQQQLKSKQASRLKEASEQNKKDGAAFQAENKKKAGVTTLANGIQYRVLKAGTGAQPSDEDTVTVNYSGTLTNGQEFDSSYKRNKPVTIPLNSVIPGWREALKLMKAGSTWEVVIPSDLAYGAQGIPMPGSPIGPNQTLVFKIELISVDKNANKDKKAVATK